MGTFSDVQNVNYRFLLELIKNEEHYDKNKRVISGLEAFYLCHKRYESLQNVLAPIKNKIGQDVVITGVNFSNAMQDEKGIAIKYIKNDKLYMMSISTADLGIVNISLSDQGLDNDLFLEENYDVILSVINELNGLDYLDYPEIILNSSSKRLIISDNFDDFIIKNNDEKVSLLGTNHYLYEKDKKIFIPEKINNIIKSEELMNEDNIEKIYNNLRIYEDDFPKTLIKKIK